jgi:ABC-type polysaccharide/polyol phosphate transport system ATPase subunit
MSAQREMISLDKVSLSYLSSPAGPSLKQLALQLGRRQGASFERKWALNEIQLSVDPGEIIGLIGHNGAGKSSLLRLIAGVLPPTTGRVIVRGQTTPILDLGTGIHADATGRDTIVFFGALLGRDPRLMAERAPAIAEWAGLSNYLDRPVRSYSAGMVARLSFAATTDAAEDVLLLDEVLGVGDLKFIPKCMDRIHELTSSGTTVLIASHNLPSVQAHADRVLWLDSGSVMALGDPREVIDTYAHSLLATQIP